MTWVVVVLLVILIALVIWAWLDLSNMITHVSAQVAAVTALLVESSERHGSNASEIKSGVEKVRRILQPRDD